jgi:hypothetical protein
MYGMGTNQIGGMLSLLLLEAGVAASLLLLVLLVFDCDDPSVASSLLKLKHAASSTSIGLCGTEEIPLRPLFTKACPCISS